MAAAHQVTNTAFSGTELLTLLGELRGLRAEQHRRIERWAERCGGRLRAVVRAAVLGLVALGAGIPPSSAAPRPEVGPPDRLSGPSLRAEGVPPLQEQQPARARTPRGRGRGAPGGRVEKLGGKRGLSGDRSRPVKVRRTTRQGRPLTGYGRNKKSRPGGRAGGRGEASPSRKGGSHDGGRRGGEEANPGRGRGARHKEGRGGSHHGKHEGQRGGKHGDRYAGAHGGPGHGHADGRAAHRAPTVTTVAPSASDRREAWRQQQAALRHLPPWLLPPELQAVALSEPPPDPPAVAAAPAATPAAPAHPHHHAAAPAAPAPRPVLVPPPPPAPAPPVPPPSHHAAHLAHR